ncbi:YveK family protein [Clostridium perfringens]|uniref:YveK family protein n=1 Tax=Clostridium perfringens TaxID=1502 RepID=UPI000E145214|nr:Wzz/FepE/Etk N-terminal domain-containing protein [Clostridium perfringens]MDM0445817.1 Wzz/FepE/Etk N-terminal domain-containing protein [Clostridium perfringens]MDM0451594.1 Wzz/FepE/Etk N-terminal domain-containing protein [Clostridium perfringens]SUY29933.1 capsular polysaccharide biosynthesis protein [Clostridium perfringens]HBI6898461.1 capsular biosynthesis protein [Clostridium perfringens]HBI6899140.1 capsular biosynthesis protein [Clostridium perfringens]
MEEKTLDIQEVLYALKKRYKIIIIIILLPILFSAYKAYKMKPSYQSKVKFFIGKEGIKGTYSVGELEEYKKMVGAYVEIFNNEDVVSKLLKKANIDLPANYVRSGLSFIPSNGSIPTLEISYVSYNKEEVEKIINVMTNEFKSTVGEYIVNSNIEILDYPKSKTIIPNKKKVVLLGGVIGLVLSLGAVLILDYLDNSIKNKKELEKILPIPVIGEIPIHD